MRLNLVEVEGALLACYGTLRRRGLFAHVGFRVAGGLRFWGYGRVRGCLHWQAFFPALVPGPGLVPVEVYRVNGQAVLACLDRYEGFDPENTGRSVFIRRRAFLEGTSRMVWLYSLNQSVRPGFPIRPLKRVSASKKKVSACRRGRAVGVARHPEAMNINERQRTAMNINPR